MRPASFSTYKFTGGRRQVWSSWYVEYMCLTYHIQPRTRNLSPRHQPVRFLSPFCVGVYLIISSFKIAPHRWAGTDWCVSRHYFVFVSLFLITIRLYHGAPADSLMTEGWKRWAISLRLLLVLHLFLMPPYRRLQQYAIGISIISILYNGAEGAVSVGLGSESSSRSLIFFGV